MAATLTAKISAKTSVKLTNNPEKDYASVPLPLRAPPHYVYRAGLL